MKPEYLLSLALLVSSFSAVAAAEPSPGVSAVVKEAVPQSRELSQVECGTYPVMKAKLVSMEDVEKMETTTEPPGVMITLTEEGGKKFAAATAGMKESRLAIRVMERIRPTLMIQKAPLGRVFLIMGLEKAAEAEEVVAEFAKIKK